MTQHPLSGTTKAFYFLDHLSIAQKDMAYLVWPEQLNENFYQFLHTDALKMYCTYLSKLRTCKDKKFLMRQKRSLFGWLKLSKKMTMSFIVISHLSAIKTCRRNGESAVDLFSFYLFPFSSHRCDNKVNWKLRS